MKLLTGWGYAKLSVNLLLLVMTIVHVIHSISISRGYGYFQSYIYVFGVELINTIDVLADTCFTITFLVGLAQKSSKLLRIFSVYSVVACFFLISHIKTFTYNLPGQLSGYRYFNDISIIIQIVRVIVDFITLVFQIYVTILTVKLLKKLDSAQKMEPGRELSAIPHSAPTTHATPYYTPQSSAPPNPAPLYSEPSDAAPLHSVPLHYPTLPLATSGQSAEHSLHTENERL